jgi:hypothetical protein
VGSLMGPLRIGVREVQWMFLARIVPPVVLSLRGACLVLYTCIPDVFRDVEDVPDPLAELCRTLFLALAKVFSSLLPMAIEDGSAGCSCE